MEGFPVVEDAPPAGGPAASIAEGSPQSGLLGEMNHEC